MSSSQLLIYFNNALKISYKKCFDCSPTPKVGIICDNPNSLYMINGKSKYFDENGHYKHEVDGYRRRVNDFTSLSKKHYFTSVLNSPSKSKEISMTLCIACLADDGTSAVLAADDMVTHYIDINTSYKVCDPKVNKIMKIAQDIYVLIAGDGDKYMTVINQANISHGDNPNEVADSISKSLQAQNYKHKENSILIPIGLTWSTLMQMHSDALMSLQKDLQNCTIGTEFIVVGRDSQTNLINAYHITPDGIIHDRTTEGLAIIGIGFALAKLSFLKDDFNKHLPLSEIEILIRRAMEEGSKSPNVGKLNELIIIPRK
jgi:20S proteasome alpha/beta subunit